MDKERTKERIKYLETELAHKGYYDGWTVKGMKEELEGLIELIKNEPNDMELGNKVRAKYLTKEGYKPKGKSADDDSYYWFTRSWIDEDSIR